MREREGGLGRGSVRRLRVGQNHRRFFPTPKLFLRLLTSKSLIIPLILVLSQWNTRHLFYSLIFYRIPRTANTDAIRNHRRRKHVGEKIANISLQSLDLSFFVEQIKPFVVSSCLESWYEAIFNIFPDVLWTIDRPVF